MSENNGKDPENGRFLNGNSGKPHGAVMKSTTKIKHAVATFLELNIEKIQESFDELEPVQKLQFITAILPYAVPKLSSSQNFNEGEIDHRITVTWEMPNLNFDELQGRTHKGSLGE